MPRMNLEGAAAIVTGGASGIGEECARQLAELGARVVIADIQEDRGWAVAAETKGTFVRCDVSSEADGAAAVEAAGLGLVTQVTDPGSAVDTALRLAQRVAKNAPLAVATSKDLVKASQGLTEAEFWTVQQRHNATIFNSGDAREGARAFAEKRPPEWSGT